MCPVRASPKLVEIFSSRKTLTMYIENIILTHSLPCLAEPGKIIVIGKPSVSLAAVIPYLATLPGIIGYNPETLTLTFRRQPGFMTLFPDKVTITQIKDAEEGLGLFSALTDAINAVWDQRAELIAIQTAKRAPHWLDIWRMLPQTNCKQCGEATCMAFAAGLVQQKRELAECLPLQADQAFAERQATLEAML